MTDFLAEAERIGEQLVQDATKESDGTLSWGRGEGRHGQPSVDSGLGNGRIGEALFLAGLSRVSGREVFYRTAKGAIQTIRAGASSPEYVRTLLDANGVGIRGIGGTLYALSWIGRLLDSQETIADAASLAWIAKHIVLRGVWPSELLMGSAGLILGLSALPEATVFHRSWIADLADELLAMRSRSDRSGLLTWDQCHSNLSPGGFAHGGTGIAHALVRASLITGNADYYAAAEEHFAHEWTLYRPDEGRWPERADDSRPFVAWCHGATGFAFARLGAIVSRMSSTEEPMNQFRAAVVLTKKVPLSILDCLCCGNLGRVDLLLSAGVTLADASWTSDAHRLARVVIRRAASKGYGLPSFAAHAAPGLLQGLTGIGYEMLRLAAPAQIPSLLTLD